MAAGIFGSVEHTKVTWAWAFHHVWEWPHKECWGWTLTLVWNQNTRSATTNYTCRSIISHEVSMLLNSSSVQKQNYRLRVLRKTLTPSIGDAHLRLRTFLLVNKSNHAFSEVKRIQQLEENGGCALKKKKKKSNIRPSGRGNDHYYCHYLPNDAHITPWQTRPWGWATVWGSNRGKEVNVWLLVLSNLQGCWLALVGKTKKTPVEQICIYQG